MGRRIESFSPPHFLRHASIVASWNTSISSFLTPSNSRGILDILLFHILSLKPHLENRVFEIYTICICFYKLFIE